MKTTEPPSRLCYTLREHVEYAAQLLAWWAIGILVWANVILAWLN